MFILRVVSGIIFLYAGWYKFQNMAMTAGFFANMHMAPWVASGITWLEIIGGIALILGLWTCFFAPIFAIEMAVATYFSYKMGGFQMAETPLLLLAAVLAIKHVGRGRWALGKHCGCLVCRNKESRV
jgi:putative oxidoreductase